METITSYRNIIIENLTMIIDRIITIFSRETGLSYENSQVTLLIIIEYIIGMIIFIKIHKIFLRKKIQAMKECTFAYDEIIYLIAKEEYNLQWNITNSPIQALIQTTNKNYFKNHAIIMDAIRELEAQNKHIIFTPEMEKKILTLRKKTLLYNRVEKIIGSIISIGTVGIYLLFR